MSSFTITCISDTLIKPRPRKKTMALHPCSWNNGKAQSGHHLVTSRMTNAHWRLVGVRVEDPLKSHQGKIRRHLGCHRWRAPLMSRIYLTWRQRAIQIRCLGFLSWIIRILRRARESMRWVESMDSRIIGRRKVRKGSIQLLPVITIANRKPKNHQKNNSISQSGVAARLTFGMKPLMMIPATRTRISSLLTSRIQSIARSTMILHTSFYHRWSALATDNHPMMLATPISQA